MRGISSIHCMQAYSVSFSGLSVCITLLCIRRRVAFEVLHPSEHCMLEAVSTPSDCLQLRHLLEQSTSGIGIRSQRLSVANMSTSRASSAHNISSMLMKLHDPDPDIRFMQLSDLHNALSSSSTEWLRSDPNQAGRIIDGLLKSLTDQHGEVQNQALKW
jgi:hypothetical protein